MSAAPPPNWYPDPSDAAQLRWWDGSQWTEHLHGLAAAAPVTVQPVTQPPVVDQWAAARTPEVSSPVPKAPEPVSVFEPAPIDPTPARDLAPLQPAGQAFADPTTQAWKPQEHTWSTPAPLPVPMHLGGGGGAPPRDRKPMIIGAAVIAVLLVGIIAFVATRGGDDDSGDIVAQSPTTTAVAAATGSVATAAPTSATATTSRPAGTSVATTAAPTLAGTTFSDPTNVYRLRVAPTWQDATVVGGLQTWSTGTSSSVFRDSVNVLIEKLPGDISMDDYLTASVKNGPKALPSFVEISRSVNTVNGKTLGQLDFRSNQNIPLRHRAVVLIKGRNAIVVTYTIEPARFDAEIVKVQPYLTSIEGV